MAITTQGFLDKMTNSRNIIIKVDQDTSGPVNVLLQINQTGNNSLTSVSKQQSTISSNHDYAHVKKDDIRNKRTFLENQRRQRCYNFYTPTKNIDNLPGDDSLNVAKIQEWTDWRRKANLHMVTTITDKENSRIGRDGNIAMQQLDSETVFNIYRNMRSSESSTSVLGIRSFTMFGIPRIQQNDFHDNSLYIEELHDFPPDYDEEIYEVLPDYDH